MTLTAGQMHMSVAMPGVIKMAYTIFLRPCPVVNIMQQMSLR